MAIHLFHLSSHQIPQHLLAYMCVVLGEENTNFCRFRVFVHHQTSLFCAGVKTDNKRVREFHVDMQITADRRNIECVWPYHEKHQHSR